MNFDDLKIIWDEGNDRRSYAIDEEALNRIVIKRARSLRRKLFWRDFREIGIAIPLIAYFLWKGIQVLFKNEGTLSLRGSGLVLIAAGLAFMVIYFLVGRFRQKERDRKFETSIRGNLMKLISNIAHQIRLLNSIFWWSMFPLIPGGVLVIYATAEVVHINPLIRMLICTIVFYVVYRLNKRAVRTYLKPERAELESLLSRLEEANQD